ncbi:hypothetical protein EYF80_038200 [Liparis tanakae]|uniref:Uncharacterized protein n=1 Tax=Liparis tanakae TaxID=230148 RepID=A0A4Z2GFW4_9TELE|nr:hypothetical protein EYF80_038200 [Liparis tanakae]
MAPQNQATYLPPLAPGGGVTDGARQRGRRPVKGRPAPHEHLYNLAVIITTPFYPKKENGEYHCIPNPPIAQTYVSEGGALVTAG